MAFNEIIRISEHPARADKSAMGAINRPYGWADYFVNVHHYARVGLLHLILK